ncbi:polysaccharide deacetylase family protein [Achromobacter insuavis]
MTAPKTVLVTLNVQGIGPEAAARPEHELHGRDGHGRYTYGGGLARVLDMLRRQEIRATLFWPAFEAERCRDLLEQSLRDGHEAASQGNAFEDLATLGEREAEVLQRGRDRLAALTGQAPQGFRWTGGGFSAHPALAARAGLPLRQQRHRRRRALRAGRRRRPRHDRTALERGPVRRQPFRPPRDPGPRLCAPGRTGRRAAGGRGLRLPDAAPARRQRRGTRRPLQMIERLLDRLRAAGAGFARCDDLAREHAAGA